MEKQFEQLMLYYNQLKEMAFQISGMLEREAYNEALTMLNHRKRVVKELGLMLRYIEMTDEQKQIVDNIRNEIYKIEAESIKKLQKDMEDVKYELDIASSKVRFRNKYNPYEVEQATGNVIDTHDNDV